MRVAVQTVGSQTRIIAAGTRATREGCSAKRKCPPEGGDFAVARYSASGALDPTFGTSGAGLVFTDLGGYDDGSSVAVTNAGKIVVAGSTCSSANDHSCPADFAVARYNANGTLDTTFGAGNTGRVMTNFGGRDLSGDVLIQPADGRILVAGDSVDDNGGLRAALARYLGS